MQHYKSWLIQKNRMKIIIVNSKIKQKSKNFGGDQKSSSWFYSLLCYCLYYMRIYLIHVTWAQGKTPDTLCITWGIK